MISAVELEYQSYSVAIPEIWLIKNQFDFNGFNISS